MRSNLTRAITVAAALIAAGVGLSGCVTEGYDPYPRYGYYDRHDHRWGGWRRDDHRWDDRRGWVDRDGDGRRDWWEGRR